eukprot:843364-Rhodomonas_salina.1
MCGTKQPTGMRYAVLASLYATPSTSLHLGDMRYLHSLAVWAWMWGTEMGSGSAMCGTDSLQLFHVRYSCRLQLCDARYCDGLAMKCP